MTTIEELELRIEKLKAWMMRYSIPDYEYIGKKAKEELANI